MQLTIRVDASVNMGLGHVVRCRTLARFMKSQGANVNFICRAHPGHQIDALCAEGFSVDALPPPKKIQLSNHQLSAGELGLSQQEDAHETLAVLQARPDWLLVDHYGLDAQWEDELKYATNRLMVIDDLANRPHNCDLLLDQNFVRNADVRYHNLLPITTNKLLGPKYALLHSAYRVGREKQARTFDGVKRVLLFFGGSDSHNLTSLALEALLSPGLSHLAVDCVVGVNNLYKQQLQNRVDSRDNIQLHHSLPNLAELMVQADLAIGAGGTTTWERCCLGLPSIVVSTAENQRASCEALAADGCIFYLDHWDKVQEKSIIQGISHLMANGGKRQQLSRISSALVDGRGIERVMQAMLELR
jgi:UDP-2,4-diacetamido-2,4,6-trideoxy-beta-L-altropyranose hydrolase